MGTYRFRISAALSGLFEVQRLKGGNSQVIAFHVQELIQAGDVFLIQTECPKCRFGFMTGTSNVQCPECPETTEHWCLVIPKTRVRLLAGSKRKNKIGKAVIRKIIAAHGMSCAYCSEDLDLKTFHIDHVVPLAVGGTNNLDNLCLSCPACNLAGGARAFATFAIKKDYILARRKP